MQPLSQTEAARFRNASLSAHYSKFRPWYVNSARSIIRSYAQAAQKISGMPQISINPQTASKPEIFQLIKCWLENCSEWEAVLTARAHIKFKDHDFYTDAMARWIVDDAFAEITK